MTGREAINELMDYVAENDKITISVEAVTMARNALEKQIPKKIWGNKHNPVYIGDTVNGLCPICNTEFVCITPRLFKQEGYGYCKQCGQKLDW